MKRALVIFCLGVFSILAVICVGAFYYDSLTPTFAQPAKIIDLHLGNRFCASELCHQYAKYEFAGSESDLIGFYRGENFFCQEIRGPSDGGLFPMLQDPYWQCSGNAFPKGNVEIGFNIPPVNSSEKAIKVQVHITWSPIM